MTRPSSGPPKMKGVILSIETIIIVIIITIAYPLRSVDTMTRRFYQADI
jgi:hypothetical protein